MSEQEFISNKVKEGFTKAQATMMAKMSFAKNIYAQQGDFVDNKGYVQYEVGKGVNKLNNLQAQQLNKSTRLEFTPEFAKSGYFVTEEQFDEQSKQRQFEEDNLKKQRLNKITAITAETQSPFANRRIWHDKNPEYYTGRQEVIEGNQYTTIPYKQWADYQKSPQYLAYKNKGMVSPPQSSVASMQQGGVNYAQQAQFPPFENSLDGYIPNYQYRAPNQPQITDKNAQTQIDKNTYINYQQNPQEGINLDPNDNSNIGNIQSMTEGGEDASLAYGSPEMQQRMAENKQYNTATNNYDERGNAKDTSEERRTTYNNSRTNIINPYAGVGLEQSLDYFSRGLGEGDGYKIGVGGALSLLKSARTVGVGYSTGKENRRIDQEYDTRRFENLKKYEYLQMGGKVKNSDILAQNAIVDQGQGNINMEGGEIVQNPQGQIQPVYGSRHIENGKIAEGVNATLEDGSKILSDAKGLITLSAKDAKELKDRYNISVKKGDTPAQAQKKFDAKIGLKKEQDVLANYAEKMEKTLTIKDSKTKEVNLDFLQKSIAKTNTKIETLSELSKVVFDDLFDIQESKPKKGDGSQLFDSKGKEITQKKEGVMQEGGEKNSLWKNIRNNRGSGKKPTKEMLEQERKINNSAQQGGNYGEILAQKYGISLERAQELMQMGGESMQDEQEPQQQIGIEEQIVGALQNGAQPEEIMQQLAQSMPPEQAQQMIQDVMGNMQGEASQGQQSDPTQIIEAYAQIAQQDPQGIKQQLQQMQPQEQQQALQQMMSAVQEAQGQQDQGQDGEQNPAQEAQSMQSGGQVYAQQAKIDPKYTFFTPGTYDLTPEEQLKEDYLKQGFVKGFDGLASGGVNPQERVVYQNSQVPYLMKDSGMYDGKTVNLKNTGKFQNGWANYRNAVEKAVKVNKYLSPEQSKNYGQKLTDEKFNLSYNVEKNKSKNEQGFDAVYGRETSEKGGFNLPLITEDDKKKYPNLNFIGDAVGEDGKIKSEFKDLDPNTIKDLEDTFKATGKDGRDIGLGTVQSKINPADKTAITPTAGAKPKVEYTNTTKNVMPQLPVNLRMFPSAMPALAKEQVNYGLLDPIKATPEAMLAEQERQRQTAQEQVQQSGLSAAQQEAVMAQGLAASQMASNDAINKTQDFNNQNQFTVNQFNNQQRTRQSMSDANFNQDYQNKVLGSAAATVRDIRNFYTEGNLQNRADYNSIENANLLNAKSDEYQYTPGQGVEFINNQKQDISTPMGVSPEQWKLMSTYEKNARKKAEIERINNIKQMGGKKKAFFGY